MSYLSPAMVVGAALLDEVFAQALLADPRHALTIAQMDLAPADLAPFLEGANSLAELARAVYTWEMKAGRTEQPLRVPSMEPRLDRPARNRDRLERQLRVSLAA